MLDPDVFEEETTEIPTIEWMAYAFCVGGAVGSMLTWWIWG